MLYNFNMELKYIKNKNDNYISVNDILKMEFNISTRLLTKLINQKNVKLNNKICDTREHVKIDDIVTVNMEFEEENSNIVPFNIKLNIVYEDEWMLVIDKPAGYAVHPSALHYDDSISNGVKYYFDKIRSKKKIRPVNRLDRNTSGLVIFAKCEYIQECLSKQMLNKSFKKEYIAIVSGKFANAEKSGTINLPIARKENSIIERCINKDGQKAITHYEVIKQYNKYSLVKCSLETGRTHQIRVHMSAISHPLIR